MKLFLYAEYDFFPPNENMIIQNVNRVSIILWGEKTRFGKVVHMTLQLLVPLNFKVN